MKVRAVIRKGIKEDGDFVSKTEIITGEYDSVVLNKEIDLSDLKDELVKQLDIYKDDIEFSKSLKNNVEGG